MRAILDPRRTFVLSLLAVVGAACGNNRPPADVQVLPDAPGDAVDDLASDAGTGLDTADVVDDRAMCSPRLPVDDVRTIPSRDPTGCIFRDATVDVLPTWTPPPGADAGSTEAGPAVLGPGGPSVTFRPDQLTQNCAYLHGGPTDRNHHNAAFMHAGYLIMPWAHEATPGGISVWEFNDPCRPVHVATVTDPRMRETHATGFSFIGGRWMVVASTDGIVFWDISDFRNMRRVSELILPNTCFPDSYRRVVMGTFWQAPYVYVGTADNGVFVVDASDPRNPRIVNQYVVGNSVGLLYAIGNNLYIVNSEGSTQHILDISDPAVPRPIPGGRFEVHNGRMIAPGYFLVLPAYSGTYNGNRGYFTRHTVGAGLFIFDVANPSMPRFLGQWEHPTGRADSGEGPSGGYVYVQNDLAFAGFSSDFVVFDIADPTHPTPISTLRSQGDDDTIVPMGNVVLLSVDDGSVPGQATSVVPFREQPDRRAPAVNMIVPRDAATDQALTSRVGVTFDEFVDVQTLDRTTFIVREVGSSIPLEGYYSGQENAVNFWPAQPLRPGATYEVIVPAGGVRDASGNATSTTFRSTFRASECR